MTERDRWLVLSYYAGIDSLAPSIHVDDRVKELKRLNIEPVLINSACSGRVKGVWQRRVPSPAPSGLRYELRYILRRMRSTALASVLKALSLLIIIPFYAIESLLLDIGASWSWPITAALPAILAMRKYRCHVIYSTGGPWCAHVVGAICRRIGKALWIAEFQDPLAGPWVKGRRLRLWLARCVERMVCRRADAVIFLTHSALEEARLRTNLGDRGHAVYAGAPEEWQLADVPPTSGESFRVGHIGSLGGDRTLHTFLTAAEIFLERLPEARKHLKITLAGNLDGTQKRIIDRSALRENIEFLGKVPREEARRIAASCDVLLLVHNQSATARVTFPSKTFEYLLLGRPMLGLVYENEELARLLEERGHDVADVADTEDIAEKLAELYSHSGARSSSTQKEPLTVRKAVQYMVRLAADRSADEPPAGRSNCRAD